MSAATPIIQRFSLVFVSLFKHAGMLYQVKQDASFLNLSSSAFTNHSTIQCVWATDGVVKLTINKLTKWSSTHREKLIVPQVVKNLPFCTQPKNSLPFLQRPDFFPHPEPYRSTPRPSSRFLKESVLILSLPIHLILPSGFFPLYFFTKTMCEHLLSVIRATCPVYLNRM